MSEFTDLSGNAAGGRLPGMQSNAGAVPTHLQGIARSVVGMVDIKADDLEAHLAQALEHVPNASYQDTQDAQIRAAKRQLGLAFVGALEKLCAANQPLEAERWARAMRTQYLLGELELLQVDCLNQLAILYFSRNQLKRALKAVKAALKLVCFPHRPPSSQHRRSAPAPARRTSFTQRPRLPPCVDRALSCPWTTQHPCRCLLLTSMLACLQCNRLEQLGLMTHASAATRRAALHLNSSDTLARLKRHDEALRKYTSNPNYRLISRAASDTLPAIPDSANSALQLLEPLADTSVEEAMGAELRISAMHSVGMQRQNTGDTHGASSMLAQASQLAIAKL